MNNEAGLINIFEVIFALMLIYARIQSEIEKSDTYH